MAPPAENQWGTTIFSDLLGFWGFFAVLEETSLSL